MDRQTRLHYNALQCQTDYVDKRAVLLEPPPARPHNLTTVRYACRRQKAHHNPARNHSSSLLSAGRQAGAREGRRGRRCNAVNAQHYHNSRLNASQTKNGGANERSCSDATDIPSHHHHHHHYEMTQFFLPFFFLIFLWFRSSTHRIAPSNT